MFRYFYFFVSLAQIALASPYDPREVAYNLNQNADARNPLEYWGTWDNHTFNPSPTNWRFPFYTFFLDRSVLNGADLPVDTEKSQTCEW